ncbi:hypothetical protein GY663_31595, partial [Klebsiella michiganensis]|nr:hypothetical protein [Klebsiella michiganensis]
TVPSAQRLGIARDLHVVRFCFKQDEATAQEVKQQIERQSGSPLEIHRIGVNGSCERVAKPGIVEVWIGKVG